MAPLTTIVALLAATTAIIPQVTASPVISTTTTVSSTCTDSPTTTSPIPTGAATSACTNTLTTVTATGSVGNWPIINVSVASPAPTLVGKNYVLDQAFVAQHGIGGQTSPTTSFVNETSDDFGYYEFKCQYVCSENDACHSWFIASEATNGQSALTCSQFNALMDSTSFVAAPANMTGFGIGYNIGNLCPSPSATPSSITRAIMRDVTNATSTCTPPGTVTSAVATSTCTPPGTVTSAVPIPTSGSEGGDWYVDDDFVKAHRFSYLISNDFVSTEDFYEKCMGQCAESGPIGGPVCNSMFMAYGVPDYANEWPQEGCCDEQWLCQLFNATLTADLYKPATTAGTWTYPQGFNNLC